MLREAEYYSLIALLDYLQDPDPTTTTTLELAFDSTRKGDNIAIYGATATTSSRQIWKPAFTASTFTRGVHSCTISGTSIHFMAGISGANVDHTSAAHSQVQTMMFHVGTGDRYVGGVETKSAEYYPSTIRHDRTRLRSKNSHVD